MTALVDDATTKRQHVDCVVQWSTSLNFWQNRRVWIRYKESDNEETSVVNWTLESALADSVLSIGRQDRSTDDAKNRRFVQVWREEVDDTRRSSQSLRISNRQRRVWIFKINEKIIVNVMIYIIYTRVISDRWRHMFRSFNDPHNEGRMKIVSRVEDVTNVKTRDAMSTDLIHVNLWSTIQKTVLERSRTWAAVCTLSIESSTQWTVQSRRGKLFYVPLLSTVSCLLSNCQLFPFSHVRFTLLCALYE